MSAWRKYGLAMVAQVMAIGTLAAEEPTVTPRVEASRTSVQSFSKDLKSALVTALKDSGPISAIEVCSVEAPGIARSQSNMMGWDVGRTSLKLRNPDNAPDDWERGVLEAFEARKDAGEDVTSMEYWEITEVADAPAFRYMKAIPTAEVCLTCHGTDIAPDLAAKLDALYPKDEARGYSLGDIRGAFTIIQPM